MLSPQLNLYLDNILVDANRFYDVALYSAIDSTLPVLTFKIEDSSGKDYADFKFYVGAHIDVVLYDKNAPTTKKGNSDAKASTKYTRFVVTRIFNGFEASPSSLGGFIQIWCTQAWAFYANYKGRIYKPQKISSIIKEVCKGAHEYARITVEDDNFVDSTDLGRTPRYKICESEVDFINTKLLPFVDIGNSNPFFFVNSKGAAHLSSFTEMFSKPETSLIVPQFDLQESIGDKIVSLRDELGLLEVHMYDSLTANIGDEDISKQMAPIKNKKYVQDNNTGIVVIGKRQPNVAPGKNSGKNIQASIPFKYEQMIFSDATSSAAIVNRTLDDAVGYIIGDDVGVNDFFRVTVQMNMAFEASDIGDTVNLLVPIFNKQEPDKDSETEEEDKKAAKKIIHWINGKWLVASKTINKGRSLQSTTTTIDLIRPTFMINETVTTVLDPQRYYQL